MRIDAAFRAPREMEHGDAWKTQVAEQIAPLCISTMKPSAGADTVQ
jgi:hypothetical protein